MSSFKRINVTSTRILMAGALALTMAVAQLAMADNSFQLRPGAVVDSSRTTVYVMQPQGGIAALDVVTGEERWSTDAAARPLYADDEYLVAQAEMPGRYGMLHLVVLDVNDPQVAPTRASVEMPQGAQALVVAGRRATFDIWAARAGEVVEVGWTYTKLEKTAVDSAARNAAARRTWDGAVRVPLGRGPVREIDASRVPNPKRGVATATLPALDGLDPAVVERGVGGGLHRAGSTVVHVDLPTRDPRQPAQVQRWDANDGKSLGSIELFGDGRLVKNVSADGRYLLGSTRVDGNAPFGSYDWSVVDLKSGQAAAAFRHTDPAASFFVTANRVVVDATARGHRQDGEWIDQPLMLQGLDRASGSVRWSYAIRDTAYTGDMPPVR